MAKKLTVGVVFGGRSGEHEVSLVSATSVMKALDKSKYDILPIGITKDGRWFAGDGVMEALKAGKTPPVKQEVIISSDPGRNGVYNLNDHKLLPIDVAFPILHGTFGEDGTIQGLFEMAGIPYVGAGVLGSSVGMDKIMQKEVARAEGATVVPFVWFLYKNYLSAGGAVVKQIEEGLGYPVFVKPSNSGSSVGIAKAKNRKELEAAIKDAGRYDRRILVEKGIVGAREIEVSVLGNDEVVASCCGEVIPSNEFYDYDAKYVDGKSKTLVPAELDPSVAKKIQAMAIHSHRAIDCSGMARVDFLVTKDKIYLNELNTIPGFTSISMYPKLFEASGIPYPELLDRLITLALERHDERAHFLTSYKPKAEWFR
jgi:D-alanine-D-alanine ligase